MDDRTVTEHWERLEEGYDYQKPKLDNDKEKEPKVDNPGNSRRRPPLKKPSASAPLQSALRKRAREDKGKQKGSAKKTK